MTNKRNWFDYFLNGIVLYGIGMIFISFLALLTDSTVLWEVLPTIFSIWALLCLSVLLIATVDNILSIRSKKE